MPQLNPYLTFNGNCREAMVFYQKCLGGELVFQTVGESPLAEKMPPEMRDRIVHSELKNGSFLLMGSDMSPADLIRGNAVSMMLHCQTEAETRLFYKLLASGGTASHSLEWSFWGALFGHLTDRFGVQWMLNFSRKTV